MSDLHIRLTPKTIPVPGMNTEILSDSGEKLRIALRHAKGLEPDFFIFTGDLVFEGAKEDYEQLKAVLDDELKYVPYFFALGNHDRRAAFWEGFMNEPGKDAPYYSCESFDGLRVISLDSSPVDGCILGRFLREQTDFVREILKEPSPKGSILLFHHPINCAFERFAGHLTENGAELIEALKGGDVRAVFTGHTHFSDFHTVGGVLCATAPSTCFGMDLIDENVLRFTDASSYLMGRISEDCVFVSQVDVGGAEVLFNISAENFYQLYTEQHEYALKNGF
jgi:3',5'-cyclic AMP phosphodiesterase CpdA